MPRVPRRTDRVCVGRFRLGLLVTLNGQDRGFVYDVSSATRPRDAWIQTTTPNVESCYCRFRLGNKGDKLWWSMTARTFILVNLT
jgi:hypothetical protein